MADEDALEQVFRGQLQDAEPDVHKRTRFFRRRLEQYFFRGYDGAWSVGAIGNCTHKGDIPPQAVTRVVLIHDWWDARFTFAFDPTISVLNFQLLGEKYREMQKLFLGRPYDAKKIANPFASLPTHDRAEEAVQMLDHMLLQLREVVYDREWEKENAG